MSEKSCMTDDGTGENALTVRCTRIYSRFVTYIVSCLITSTMIVPQHTSPLIKKQRTMTSQLPHDRRRITRFDHLPNELILMICRYLKPIDVLNIFVKLDYRYKMCISDYYTQINLTSYSYTDMQYILNEFLNRRLLPSTLILSNILSPNQIETFFSNQLTTSTSSYLYVHHLLLIDCKPSDMGMINWYMKLFPSLHSLCLVESISHENYSMTSLTHELLRQIIFNKNFTELTEIDLIINKGLVLDKNLQSNLLLTRLTISLRTIDDLLVLLDGLVPNLIELDVILCTNHVSRRLLLPLKSTVCQMIHLTKFELDTKDEVEMRLEYLLNIGKFLSQLNTFIICIDNWTSPDGMFVQGNQIEMFINQFMPCLEHFHCFIRTQCRIDMTTFIGLNQRWPIVCGQKCNDSYNHLYTTPWAFEDLKTSELAEEDTMSICHDVLDLKLDTPCSNLSERFPNIERLTILCQCDLSGNSFPRLRWLITEDVAVVSMIGQYIHTLMLIGRSEYSTHSTTYPHICHLTLENIQSSSLSTTMSLIQCFPNLRSLSICFSMSEDYLDSLDVLLDNKHLPHLMLFRTNWITEVHFTMPEIKLWLLEKTILKWRSKPFLASRVDDDWTVWL